jgi:hypothetical protein
MISILQLDKLNTPVLVSNYENLFVRLLARFLFFFYSSFFLLISVLFFSARDGSFFASSSCNRKVLLTPQDDQISQKFFEAHNDSVTAMVASGLEEKGA